MIEKWLCYHHYFALFLSRVSRQDALCLLGILTGQADLEWIRWLSPLSRYPGMGFWRTQTALTPWESNTGGPMPQLTIRCQRSCLWAPLTLSLATCLNIRSTPSKWLLLKIRQYWGVLIGTDHQWRLLQLVTIQRWRPVKTYTLIMYH